MLFNERIVIMISATINEDNDHCGLLVNHLYHVISTMKQWDSIAPLDIKFVMPDEEATKLQSLLKLDIPVVGIDDPATIEIRSVSMELPVNGKVQYSITYNSNSNASFIVTDHTCDNSLIVGDLSSSAAKSLAVLSDKGRSAGCRFLRWEDQASAASEAAVIMYFEAHAMVPYTNCRNMTQALMQFAPEQKRIHNE